MKFILTLLIFCVTSFQYAYSSGKVSCFYNHLAIKRVDLARVGPEELKPALSMCHYLIYGYVGLDDDKYFVKSLEKTVDLDEKGKGKNNLKAVTALKKMFPALKILLSVGGFADEDEPEKYLKVLESPKKRGEFITSFVKMIKDYDFDGGDLAWQFPIIKEKKERSTLGSIWHSVKKAVSSSSKDTKEKEHKEQFTALVRELSAALRGNKHILTLTVLPHVNHAAYFDGAGIKDSLEHIHLMTYDFKTPDRVPNEADYSAPTQYVYNRNQEQNIEAIVKWWSEHGAPVGKLLIAIPTFARTWKLTSESGKSGTPPLKADGAGEKGQYLKTEGIMAYYEFCPNVVSLTSTTASATQLRKVPDTTNRLGTYAFRLPHDSKSKGLWISYDDPEVAAKKAQYARLKGLGGVAIVDLTLDDFKGTCDNTRNLYPILRAAKQNV